MFASTNSLMYSYDEGKRIPQCCETFKPFSERQLVPCLIGHFTVVHLVAKPLIWSEAEGDLVVIETSI